MWTKVLFDLGLIGFEEPFRRLLNQGMIGGVSEKIIREGINQEEVADSVSAYSSNTFWIKWHLTNNLPTPLRPDSIDNSNEINYYLFNLSADVDFQSYETSLIRTQLNNVDNGVLNVKKYFDYKSENFQYHTSDRHEIFLCKEGYYDSKRKQWFNYNYQIISPLEFKTIQVPEKMSKRYGNVVNPDDVIALYGADTFRMYEMFLGPVEASKP